MWIQQGLSIVWDSSPLSQDEPEELTLEHIERWLQSKPAKSIVGFPRQPMHCPIAELLREQHPDTWLVIANSVGGYYKTLQNRWEYQRVLYGEGVTFFVQFVDRRRRPISKRTALLLIKRAREEMEK